MLCCPAPNYGPSGFHRDQQIEGLKREVEMLRAELERVKAEVGVCVCVCVLSTRYSTTPRIMRCGHVKMAASVCTKDSDIFGCLVTT